MFPLICVAAVLLTVNCQTNPGFNNIIAVPVSFPDNLRSQTTPPQPVLPTLPPAPSTTAPTPTFNGPLIVDSAEEEEALNLAATGANSNKAPAGNEINRPSSGSSSSCSFSWNVGNTYEPKNESFSYPRAIVSQALKGSVAELALKALQDAKQRVTVIKDGGSLLTAGINFPTDVAGSGSGGRTRLSILPPASNSNLLDNINNANGLNVNKNNNNNDRFAFATAGPSQPGLPGSNTNPNNNNNNNNNYGGQLNAFLGGFDPRQNQNGNGFNLRPPNVQNSKEFDQSFDRLFPSGNTGNNPGFPQSNFFGPQRFGNTEPNRGASSPFGFYGFEGLTPLASSPGGNGGFPTGSGNGVSYTVNGGQRGGPTPFDGINPFDIGNKFPIPRTIRKKRQAIPGSRRDIEGVCRSEPMMLREYKNHGDRCYVVHPELQQHMFVTCSNEACSKCNYPEGSSHCVPEMRGVGVWSYCENGPTAQTVDLDFISLPIMCSCKVITCS